jgi:predicted DNA-binding transcriptional regulator AlpA
MLNIDNSQKTAAYLQVSYSWIRQARSNGNGPPFIKIGKSVRYLKNDVDVWVQSQRKHNTITIN